MVVDLRNYKTIHRDGFNYDYDGVSFCHFFIGKRIVASLSVVLFLCRSRREEYFQVEEEYAFEFCTMGCNRILSTPLARPGPNLKFEMNIVSDSVY